MIAFNKKADIVAYPKLCGNNRPHNSGFERDKITRHNFLAKTTFDAVKRFYEVLTFIVIMV